MAPPKLTPFPREPIISSSDDEVAVTPDEFVVYVLASFEPVFCEPEAKL